MQEYNHKVVCCIVFLAYLLGEMRRGSNIHGSPKKLARKEWLKANGFEIDPFSSEAVKAESDSLFDIWGLPAFVDPPDFKKICGDLKESGPKYITSARGGGKSSLRRRIKWEFEQNITSAKILVIEYLNHEYSPYESHVQAHAERITHLVSQALRSPKIWQDYQKQRDLTSVEWFKRLVTYSQRHPKHYDGIYLLIDNLDVQVSESPKTQFEKLLPLMARNDINTIDGLVFKYFLPSSFGKIATGLEPSYKINLSDRDNLRRILSQRLIACLDPNLDSVPPSPLGLICVTVIQSSVEEMLLEFGEKNQGPQTMWRFGNYLLEEHFNKDPQQACLLTDLINLETFQKARDRSLQEARTFEIPRFRNIRSISQKEISTDLPQDVDALNIIQNYLRDLVNDISELRGTLAKLLTVPIENNNVTSTDLLPNDFASRNDVNLILLKIDNIEKLLKSIMPQEVLQQDIEEICTEIEHLLKIDEIPKALTKFESIPGVEKTAVIMLNNQWAELNKGKWEIVSEEFSAQKRKIIKVMTEIMEALRSQNHSKFENL